MEEKLEQLDEVARLTAVIRLRTQGDQDPLRRLRTLLKCTTFTLADVAREPVEWLTEALMDHVVTRTGATTKNPRGRAMAIHNAMNRLAKDYGETAFPKPMRPSIKTEFRVLSEQEMPKASREGIHAWKQTNADQKRGRETNSRKALKKSVEKRYLAAYPKCLGIYVDYCGVILDDTFDVRAMTMKPLVDKLLEVLDAHQSPWTVAGVVAALLRIARDLLGTDPTHEEHINHLRSEMVARFPGAELDADAILDLDALSDDGLFAPTLRSAPDAIVERSKERGISARDACTRVAAALGLEIKMSHPWMSAFTLVRLNIARHVEQIDGGWWLVVSDQSVRGGVRKEPLTPRAVAIASVWEIARKRAGLTSTLLFPIRRHMAANGPVNDDAHQSENAVCAFIISELEAVMGCRVSLRTLKKFVTHVALEKHPDQVPAISKAMGFRYSPNLARKFRATLNRSRNRKEKKK